MSDEKERNFLSEIDDDIFTYEVELESNINKLKLFFELERSDPLTELHKELVIGGKKYMDKVAEGSGCLQTFYAKKVYEINNNLEQILYVNKAGIRDFTPDGMNPNEFHEEVINAMTPAGFDVLIKDIKDRIKRNPTTVSLKCSEDAPPNPTVTIGLTATKVGC